MNIKQSLKDFVVIFVITLMVTIVVTLLWNFLVYANTLVDWDTSFRFAIILGIVLPLAKAMEKISVGK